MLHTTQLNPFLAVSQQEVLAFGSVWKPAHKWLIWTGKIGTEPMGIYLHSIKYTLCTNFNLYINSKPQSLLQMISFLILLKGGKNAFAFLFLVIVCTHRYKQANPYLIFLFLTVRQMDYFGCRDFFNSVHETALYKETHTQALFIKRCLPSLLSSLSLWWKHAHWPTQSTQASSSSTWLS